MLPYQYDTDSNRVSLNRANAAASLIPTAVTSNSYDVANEQTQFNGVTQTFDANGNFTNDGTNTYTWDARNRLTAISGGASASFTYDGLGRRKSKNISGTTTGFWYDGNDILAELSGGTPSVTYIRGLSIDEAYIRKGTGDEFYQTDALGSAVALTNGAGAGQTTYTYESFRYTTQAGTASTNSLQYTGRENDGTGLYYYRARYYGPGFERFVSRDPIGLRGGINPYSYVNNNPVLYTDPLGLKSRVCCLRIPVIGGIAGFRHCYIETETSAVRKTYGLIGGIFSGQPFGTGYIYINNSFDSGGLCGSWNGSCAADQCVKSQANAYPNPSEYSLIGPNSNTFAGTIARACNLSRPELATLATPGWNDPPAAQKDGEPYRPPVNLKP